MKISIFALSIISLVGANAAYGYRGAFDNDLGSRYKTVYLDQQWSYEDRQRFYYTPEGSYLIPYAWFMALEAADSNVKFSDPNNIYSYGYLVEDVSSLANPDHLPIGFAQEPVEGDEAWLGYSCAACHTNDIRYKRRTIRIDGAPTLSDFAAFNNGLIKALESTIANGDRFDRFAAQVVGSTANAVIKSALRTRVIEHTAKLKGVADRSKPTYAWGPARLDAFDVNMNEILGTELGQPENVREASSPVSYPFLWGTPQLDYVEWNGSAADPFARNVGQDLGTFGHIDLDITSPKLGSSSARAREMLELERLVARLGKPRWPELLFGPIDHASAARGRTLYTQSRNGEESCADCHSLPDSNGRYPSTPAEENQFGASFVKTYMTPLEVIGTDPLMATNVALRIAKTGNSAPYLPAPFTNAEQVPAPVLLSFLVIGVASVDSYLHAQPSFTPQESVELIGYRRKADGSMYTPRNLLAYRARPLDGVWATAPYLHNGSVPNLYELLLPPALRSQVFYVGSREFDPGQVGFKSRQNTNNGFLFDTRLPGNSNLGHAYGIDLSEDQRLDLLEFLKIL